VAAALRWQLGIFLVKGLGFGSPMHWINILAPSYETKMIPVAAVCGRPSLPSICWDYRPGPTEHTVLL